MRADYRVHNKKVVILILHKHYFNLKYGSAILDFLFRFLSVNIFSATVDVQISELIFELM